MTGPDRADRADRPDRPDPPVVPDESGTRETGLSRDRGTAPTSDVLRRHRLPAAAARPAERGPLSSLYLLTLLSAVDGSLVVLAATGQLSDPGTAVAVGLTVIAGAGSWLAARQAFGGRRLGPQGRRDLAALGVLTLLATVASALVGTALGAAVTLHVLPKAAGIVMCLVAAEVAGLRLPRTKVPLPLAVLAAGAALEVLASSLS